MYLVPRYVYVGTYVPGLHPQKNEEQKAYWWNCSKKTKDVPGPKKEQKAYWKQQPEYRAQGDGRLQRRRG